MIDIDAAPDLTAIASAVRACPGVSTLSDRPRRFTDDAERRVSGIRVDEDTIEITVIAFYGHRLSSVVEQIETAIRPLVGHRRLVVTVDDLDTRRGDRPHGRD